jgi:nucleotide-binding universal stress UspA family protein
VLRHILVATDFSSASERALDLAAHLTRAHRARVTVLHVYEPSTCGTPAAVAERTWPGAIRARANLDGLVRRLERGGLRAGSALRFGAPPEQIVEAAIEGGADLIVTGAHRRTGLARVWYRSVADEIVRASPIAVLTVPREVDAVVHLPRR